MKALWQGQVPLARAFWRYVVFYGTLANLVATAAALGLLSAGFPEVWSICVFLTPAPYLVAASVGVWRSADRYDGPPYLALLARTMAAVWAGLLMVI